MSEGQRYFGNWSGHEGMVSDWSDYDYGSRTRNPPKDMATDEEILFASYATPSYEGDATVIFERDGHLYEASGSHCSCNGLEGQWSPALVSWAALAMRVEKMNPPRWGFLSDHEDKARVAFEALVAAHNAELRAAPLEEK